MHSQNVIMYHFHICWKVDSLGDLECPPRHHKHVKGMSINVTDITDGCMDDLKSFVVLLYNRGCGNSRVNAEWQELLCKQNRQIENIPPIQTALLQHVKHCVFIAGHYGAGSCPKRHNCLHQLTCGWKKEGNLWEPYWTTLPEAMKGSREQVKCGCKVACKGNCKCARTDFIYTALCNCRGHTKCTHD